MTLKLISSCGYPSLGQIEAPTFSSDTCNISVEGINNFFPIFVICISSKCTAGGDIWCKEFSFVQWLERICVLKKNFWIHHTQFHLETKVWILLFVQAKITMYYISQNLAIEKWVKKIFEKNLDTLAKFNKDLRASNYFKLHQCSGSL